MRRFRFPLLALLVSIPFSSPAGGQEVQGPLISVPHERHRVDSRFWKPRLEAARATLVPALLDRLEQDGLLRNFDLAAGGKKGGHVGGPAADADVYRAIEAVALLLEQGEDAQLKGRIDGWIPRIAAAQRSDGYLSTYVTLEAPGNRFGNVRDNRELYCAGLLIEAGIAWARATGERELFDVGLKLARKIEDKFHDLGNRNPPGRQGIALALAKLFHFAGEEDLLWLGDDLLSRRGSTDGRRLWGEEVQDMLPVRKQFQAKGDVLGQLCQSRGMLEEYSITGEYALLAALVNLMRDLQGKHTYLTGALGVAPGGRFGAPSELPNALAMGDPATAVHFALLCRRLVTLTRQAAFADLEEQILYNVLAASFDPDGGSLLESAPLSSRGDVERTAKPASPRAQSELARFLPLLAEGTYAHDQDEIYVCHYLAGETELALEAGKVKLTQTTDYPWDGKVEIRVKPEKPMRLMLHVRVPIWVGNKLGAGIDDSSAELTIDRGDEPGMWLSWERLWTGEEVLELDFPMRPLRVPADPEVAGNAGRVALRRGPLVYAVEGVDNAGSALNVALPADAELSEARRDDLFGGITVLTAPAQAVALEGEKRKLAKHELTAIPYAFWACREPSPMAVWLPEDPAVAEIPGQIAARLDQLTITASHCSRMHSLAAIYDGVTPPRSSDPTTPRMTFEPRVGSKEWIRYDFDQPRRLDGVRVYFAEDDRDGGCRMPRSWRVYWKDGERWLPCKPAAGSFWLAAPHDPNEVRIEPVNTKSLRLELQLRPESSVGIFEWEVLDVP
ncbi:MAG: beta-L-arabinofuranosidase domain-containing protein [Planctomycetota bacterium]